MPVRRNRASSDEPASLGNRCGDEARPLSVRQWPLLERRSQLAKSVTGDPATLRFTIDGVPFKPYFETHGRNSVYLHVTPK